MKRKIIFRADGGKLIGMGHVVRSIALADMLKSDFTIVFAIQQPIESVIKTIHSVTETILHLPITEDYTKDAVNFSDFLESTDIVVLDGYNFKTDYQQTIKNKGCKLIAIDDLHSWHHVADAIINHADGINESVYSKEKESKLYLGLDYALLRKPFLNNSRETKKINSVSKVFISMGAADITNLTQKFTESLVQIKGIEEIHLMLGSINPNLASIDKLIASNNQIKIIKHFEISGEQLANLLQTCDLAICPASSISLECCAIGIGLISGYTAENQKGNLAGMVNRGTLINLGDLNNIKKSEITSELTNVLSKTDNFEVILKRQHELIDGNSPSRIKLIFKNLSNEK